MKQRAVVIIADYLAHRPLGRLVGLKRMDTDYVMAIEDVRDGRVHLIRSTRDLEFWVRSFKAGECLQPAFGLCVRCGRIHGDRDIDGEVFRTCVRCQTDLVELALDFSRKQEAE